MNLNEYQMLAMSYPVGPRPVTTLVETSDAVQALFNANLVSPSGSHEDRRTDMALHLGRVLRAVAHMAHACEMSLDMVAESSITHLSLQRVKEIT